MVLILLMVLFVGMAAFGGWKLVQNKQEYAAGADAYATLAATAVQQAAPEEASKDPVFYEAEIYEVPSPETQGTVPVGGVSQTLPALRVDFSVLQAINSQTVAWISGCDGAIHYPVVRGADNDYYLNHLFDGTTNRNGAIFMDYRNASDLSGRNTFLYGHNMRNGSMFAALTNYADPAYYGQHPELVLVLPGRTYSLQAFSGYVTPGNSDIYQMEFRDDAEFEAYLERVIAMSDFSSDVSVAPTDKIVTLSTCTYDYEDARYVLHCKLVPMQ